MALITTEQRNELTALFVAMFQAAPGAANLTDMVEAVEGGATLAEVAATLAAKADFQSVYPGFLTAQEFTDRVVGNLLTTDTPAGARAFATSWILGQLNAGTSRSEVLSLAVQALRATANTNYTEAKAQLTNKVAIANYYSITQEQSSTSLAALQAVVSSVTFDSDTVTAATAAVDNSVLAALGRTYNLSASIDTVTGGAGNDVINSGTGAALLTALDNIDGGDGTDTLVVSEIAAMTVPTTATVKNVESATLISGASITANTAKWTGLTSLTTTTAGGGTLTAATTTDVTATDVANTSTLAISGGNAVTATVTGTAGAITVDGSAGAVTVSQATAGAITIGGTTKVAGAVTVTDTAQTNAAIAIDGGTDVTVTNTTTGTGTVTIGNTAKPSGVITVNETLLGTGALAGGNIVVKGGTSGSVSIAASQVTNNSTTTLGAVAVTGGTTTTDVTVAGTAVATAAPTVAAVTESNAATFIALGKGASLTVGGLTFLAGSAGTTAAETAAAFANLANGATSGASTKGTYSGALSGWSTGDRSTAAVTFTSATAGNVTDLAQVTTGQTAAGVTFVKTEGVAASGKGGIAANSVSVTDAVVAGALETKASSIASVTAHHYTTLSVDSNALSSLSLLAGSGNISINNVSARTSKTTTLDLTLNGVTGGILDDADVYTTLDVTTTGAASTLANITDSALTTLTVAGDKLLTLTSAAGMTALKTVTVSGAAGLKADLSALVAGGSVNTSASTGTSTITVDASVATYTGGAGVDAVTTKAATAISKAIDLGAGDDTLTIGAGPTGVTAAVSGGDGVDTLVISTSDADAIDADAAILSKISGFEKLTLSGAVAGKSVDVSAFGPADSVTMTATASTTLTKVAAGATITIGGAQGGTLTVTGADVTGKADTLDLVQTNATGGTVDAAGYETVNLTSSVASGVITLKDAAATTLNISGTKSTTVTLDAANVALTTIDASGNSGGVTITSVSTKAATITGGSGNDVLTAKSGTTAETLVGGAGNDTLTSNAGLNTLTGGAGFDKFVIGAAGASGNVYSTIADAAAGDILVLAANQGAETFNATKLALADTASFDAFLNLAAVGDGSVNGALSWFQYGGNTYVVEDLDAAATFQGGTDVVVKLTGLVDLSNARLDGAAGNELVIG